MGRKKIDAPDGAPPAGAGGAGYRKRAGKVGITVNATPQERDELRIAAAQAGCRSMSAYLLACGLEQARGRFSRTPPAPPAPQEEGGG